MTLESLLEGASFSHAGAEDADHASADLIFEAARVVVEVLAAGALGAGFNSRAGKHPVSGLGHGPLAEDGDGKGCGKLAAADDILGSLGIGFVELLPLDLGGIVVAGHIRFGLDLLAAGKGDVFELTRLGEFAALRGEKLVHLVARVVAKDFAQLLLDRRLEANIVLQTLICGLGEVMVGEILLGELGKQAAQRGLVVAVLDLVLAVKDLLALAGMLLLALTEFSVTLALLAYRGEHAAAA